MSTSHRILSATACLAVPMLSTAAEPVTGSLGMRLYGFLKVDAIYETRDTQGGMPKWVDDVEDDDGNFFMTARQSRLGLAIDGPDAEGIRTTGKLEIDFYGDANDDSNKPRPRLRHAFAEAHWEASGVSLLAGQTWDLLSPEIASTVHFAPLWWTGDIGFRRPQIRLTKTMELAEERSLDLAAAITGNTGDMDAERPGLQVSAIYRFPLFERAAHLSLTGQTTEDKDGAQSHAINLGFDVPLGALAWARGGVWTGQNLADYLGGIGQNGPDGAEVGALGGWVQFGFKPAESPWKFHAGVALDDPDDGDLAVGARDRNLGIHGNAFYALTPQFQLAAEINLLTTTYVDGEDRDSVRFQFASVYTF